MNTLKQKLDQIASATHRFRASAQSALLKAGCEPVSFPRYISSTNPAPPLVLPTPRDISASLIERGCSPEAAKSLSDTYSQSAHQIRDAYQTTYSQACKQVVHTASPHSPHHIARAKKLALLLETQYCERLRAAEQVAIDRVESFLTKAQPPKTTFNQHFVPLLEKYFEYNAYPSAVDRATLARKSMMTPRQIEVWFQNHRNRAKKEGKVLRKLDPGRVPHDFSLESLEKQMPFFVIPELERVDAPRAVAKQEFDLESDDEGELSRRSSPTPSSVPPPFGLNAPPHAFPAIFPPSCNYDPFPVKTGTAPFPAPVWFRKPATAPLKYPPVDLETFIQDFTSKLVIRELSSKKQRRSRNSPSWFASTHTTLPCAPHPALVRSATHVEVPLSIKARPRVVVRPSRSPRDFLFPGSSNEPVTLASAARALYQTSLPRRKVAPFPRRTPKHASLSHRSTSPATSDVSSSPSRSSSSRTLSYGSDRRWSNSSPSSSSSALTTPEVAPSALPEDVHPPSKSIAVFDVDDLFGNPTDANSQVADCWTHLHQDQLALFSSREFLQPVIYSLGAEA